MKTDLYLLALTRVPEIGPVTYRSLIARFGTPEAVFKAGLNELMEVEGVGKKRAVAIKNFKGMEELEKEDAILKESGVSIVASSSNEYPESLRNLPDAPILLYIKGEVVKEDSFAVAIVGSRTPTDYGKSVADKMASELASMGFTIVSGLARGIDTVAHISAVICGGRTIGVLGSGILVPYPPENKGLMERISKSGGYVVSEFPPYTQPARENFPRRNRLISGLSMGVLVVEAAKGSGALITARHALEQGKEVFSIPGNINSSVSSGTNELIRDGAKIVLEAKDIVEELAPQLKGMIKDKKKRELEVSGEDKVVCDILSGKPTHVDDISREAGLPSQKTLSVLLGLELKGIVRQTEGKRFYLA